MMQFFQILTLLMAACGPPFYSLPAAHRAHDRNRRYSARPCMPWCVRVSWSNRPWEPAFSA